MLQHLLNSDGWKVLFFFVHDFLARVARNWACSNVRSPRPSGLGLRSLDFSSAVALIGVPGLNWRVGALIGVSGP